MIELTKEQQVRYDIIIDKLDAIKEELLEIYDYEEADGLVNGVIFTLDNLLDSIIGE